MWELTFHMCLFFQSNNSHVVLASSESPTLPSYMQGLGRNMHQLAELYVVRVAVCVGNKLGCSVVIVKMDSPYT